jgi:hypothetical protein
MKVSELQGAALIGRWRSVRAWFQIHHSLQPNEEYTFKPSTDWAQGGPIIEREKIGFKYTGAAMEFVAWVNGELSTVHDHYGPTPLIAAMRCYVASKWAMRLNYRRN